MSMKCEGLVCTTGVYKVKFLLADMIIILQMLRKDFSDRNEAYAVAGECLLLVC